MPSDSLLSPSAPLGRRRQGGPTRHSTAPRLDDSSDPFVRPETYSPPHPPVNPLRRSTLSFTTAPWVSRSSRYRYIHRAFGRTDTHVLLIRRSFAMHHPAPRSITDRLLPTSTSTSTSATATFRAQVRFTDRSHVPVRCAARRLRSPLKRSRRSPAVAPPCVSSTTVVTSTPLWAQARSAAPTLPTSNPPPANRLSQLLYRTAVSQVTSRLPSIFASFSLPWCHHA